jgi:hypothetical protein
MKTTSEIKPESDESHYAEKALKNDLREKPRHDCEGSSRF